MTRHHIARSSTGTDRKRILLVDDGPAGAELSIATLSGFGLRVQTAVTEDGEDRSQLSVPSRHAAGLTATSSADGTFL